MSDTTTVEEQQLPIEPTAPTPETPAEPEAPAPLPVQRYVYQPTDAEGRPMGGPQVLKYTTQEDLVAQLQEQNVLILRKLREETRKNRLGITETEEIPDTAPRFAAPVEFKQGDLSNEQRAQLARNILDPEKFSEVADGLFEYAMGAKPADVRKVLSTLQDKAMRDAAKAEADAFVASNDDYVICQSNFESITGWMVRYGLEPVRENFQRAYDKLKADGVLLIKAPPAPAPVEEVIPAPPPAPVAQVPPSPAPPAASIPGLPSGLNRGQGAADATNPPRTGDDIIYELKDRTTGRVVKTLTGMAAVNAMPSDEMKRRLRNPAFARAVDKLEAEAQAKRIGLPSHLDR